MIASHTRSSAKWRVIAPVLLFLLLVSAASAQAPPRIEWKAGRLSVSAERAPLAQLLREVARQSGIEVQGLAGLEERVTVRFASLPLREGLEKLLAHRDYAVLGDLAAPGGKIPAKVVVAGRRSDPPPAGSAEKLEALEAEATSAGALPPAEGPEPESNLEVEQDPEARLTALRALAREGDEEALQKALREPDQMVQVTAFELLAAQDGERAVSLLAETTKSEKPTTRLQALLLLEQSGRADKATTGAALREALADEAVTVKHYAIQALAGRGTPDAIESLRQTFRDAEPSVKIIILESLAQREQGMAFLREATRDDDEAVRSFASFWLEQIASEGR